MCMYVYLKRKNKNTAPVIVFNYVVKLCSTYFSIFCPQILLPLPLFFLRVPLPFQRAVQQFSARHVVALYSGKTNAYRSI